jgi:hypothetical protein
MGRRRMAASLVGTVLGLALLLSAQASWAQCFECDCAVNGGGQACTSDESLATSFCTNTNTDCNGYSSISETACTSLPFQDCTIILAQANPAPTSSAPALGTWPLALLVLLLAGSGWMRLARRGN